MPLYTNKCFESVILTTTGYLTAYGLYHIENFMILNSLRFRCVQMWHTGLSHKYSKFWNLNLFFFKLIFLNSLHNSIYVFFHVKNVIFCRHFENFMILNGLLFKSYRKLHDTYLFTVWMRTNVPLQLFESNNLIEWARKFNPTVFLSKLKTHFIVYFEKILFILKWYCSFWRDIVHFLFLKFCRSNVHLLLMCLDISWNLFRSFLVLSLKISSTNKYKCSLNVWNFPEWCGWYTALRANVSREKTSSIKYEINR